MVSRRPKRWVVLLRAINIGTANRIRMGDLAVLAQEAGCHDVGWHIQTGNLFVTAPGDRDDVAHALETRLAAAGLTRVDAMVRTPHELTALVEHDPFAGLDPDRFRCEVTFLRRPPAEARMERLDRVGAVVVHRDDLFACVATPREGGPPGGVNGVIERDWKVSGTARAWNVVVDIAARAIAAEAQS